MANPFNIPPTSTSNISTHTYSSSSSAQFPNTLAGNIITSTHSTAPTLSQNTYRASQSGYASQAGYGYSTSQAAGYSSNPQAVSYGYSAPRKPVMVIVLVITCGVVLLDRWEMTLNQ